MTKDTGMFNAVNQEGVRTCALHHETCNSLYGTIKEAGKGKVSTRLFHWIVGTLTAVAVTFGIALFCWTTARCDRTDGEVAEMVRKTIKMESDLEHIKAAQLDAKAELRATRIEMLEEFRRLREAVSRGH